LIDTAPRKNRHRSMPRPVRPLLTPSSIVAADFANLMALRSGQGGQVLRGEARLISYSPGILYFPVSDLRKTDVAYGLRSEELATSIISARLCLLRRTKSSRGSIQQYYGFFLGPRLRNGGPVKMPAETARSRIPTISKSEGNVAEYGYKEQEE